MNYTIKTYPLFERELKRLYKKYRSIPQDYSKLLQELNEKPTAGADLGGGVRKVRMSIGAKNKGKSGGARVITVLLRLSESTSEIGLHYIYDKSELSSLTEKEIERIIKTNL